MQGRLCYVSITAFNSSDVHSSLFIIRSLLRLIFLGIFFLPFFPTSYRIRSSFRSMFKSSSEAGRANQVKNNISRSSHCDQTRQGLKRPIIAERITHRNSGLPRYDESEDCEGTPASTASRFSLRAYSRAYLSRLRRRNDGRFYSSISLRSSKHDTDCEPTELRSHWKPITLQAPVLGGFILVSLSIIIVLEILSHISSGNGNANGGGLAFASHSVGLSSMTTFWYTSESIVLTLHDR